VSPTNEETRRDPLVISFIEEWTQGVRLLGIQTEIRARATEDSLNVRVPQRDLPMVATGQEAPIRDVKLLELSRLN